jgi:hypothetical protein
MAHSALVATKVGVVSPFPNNKDVTEVREKIAVCLKTRKRRKGRRGGLRVGLVRVMAFRPTLHLAVFLPSLIPPGDPVSQ